MPSISTPLVHYFDTVRHSVPCGAPDFAQPSTKHERNVTCPSCLAFLRAQGAPAPASAAGDASHAW